jgi:hypothetical protein
MAVSFRPCKKALPIIGGLALLFAATTARAVEPEKQPIFSNIQKIGLCGTSSSTQCVVPPDQRLIIEFVSGFVFEAPSANQTTVVSMAITDKGLGLNGASFHTFAATKVNTTPETDVFAFSAPLKMMLHPSATFYFSSVAGLAVSGYLVPFTGP